MTCKEIKEFLDKESGVDISTESRKGIYVMFRSWFYYFCYKYADDAYGLNYVGEFVSKNHCAVIHSHNKFIDRYPFDREIQSRTKIIEDRLCGYFGIIKKPMHDESPILKKDIIDFRGKGKKENVLEQKTSEIYSLKLKLNRRDAEIQRQNERIRKMKNKIHSQRSLLYHYKKILNSPVKLRQLILKK